MLQKCDFEGTALQSVLPAVHICLLLWISRKRNKQKNDYRPILVIHGELYLHWSAHLDSSTVCLSAPESRRTLCDLLPVLLSGWRTAAGFPCSPEGGWVCSDTGSSSQSSSHHTVQATASWVCWHLQHQTGGQRRENIPAKKEGKKAFIYIYIFVTEGHMTSCSDQFFVVVFFPS